MSNDFVTPDGALLGGPIRDEIIKKKGQILQTIKSYLHQEGTEFAVDDKNEDYWRVTFNIELEGAPEIIGCDFFIEDTFFTLYMDTHIVVPPEDNVEIMKCMNTLNSYSSYGSFIYSGDQEICYRISEFFTGKTVISKEAIDEIIRRGYGMLYQNMTAFEGIIKEHLSTQEVLTDLI